MQNRCGELSWAIINIFIKVEKNENNSIQSFVFIDINLKIHITKINLKKKRLWEKQ
jgi:hypothetical protein